MLNHLSSCHIPQHFCTPSSYLVFPHGSICIQGSVPSSSLLHLATALCFHWQEVAAALGNQHTSGTLRRVLCPVALHRIHVVFLSS